MKKKRSRSSGKKIAALKTKIEVERRRALRPTLPVNTQTRVSETLAERKRREAKRREQRKDWDNL